MISRGCGSQSTSVDSVFEPRSLCTDDAYCGVVVMAVELSPCAEREREFPERRRR